MAGTRVLTKYSPPSRGPLPSLWVSLCQVLGAIFCFASPASFSPSLCPLGVTGIPKSAPYFSPPLMDRTFFPAEEQQGGISRPLGASLRCIFGFCSPHIFSSR